MANVVEQVPRKSRRSRKKLSVSVRIDQADWLANRAQSEGHNTVSLIVQRALDRESEAVKQQDGEAA